MTSSMLSGERRWTSARRGGMTVLGKVAVPKPINLPSQRLENHGLDPNVEIVPKGTLSWGNKSTSSATNAWGSSSGSPNTDSASGSPSHLCGRPSSAGGGTRPSTAGSDRSHEPHANAWGPSSRPSSASGPVTLSHASLASLRPHSAETKSSSSQLSRFAETSENPVAWNSAVTIEKVGAMPCKRDGFSLTSGDFPSLGSEKECVGKDAESRDTRSSEGATMKERTGTSAIDDPKNVTTNVESANSWRSDNLPHNDDGPRPSVEKWLGHPQPYPGANIPPPHYDAWHGSPVNNPQGGVWYRGPPQGGPPYRTPVAPGNFPMDPFLYYPPHIPSGGLPNPQPSHGTGPRGHHTKTGDMYRPPMHDGFIHPGMPIRPGFYPVPVTYEGYFRPPMGYCNSSDRDAPFMGMSAGPAGPAVYNRYLGQGQIASEPASSHLVPEQVEAGLPCDNQGPYKVLLKQQGNLNSKNEEENRIISTTTNQLIVEKDDQQRMTPWENDWDHKKEVDLRRTLEVAPYSQASANQETQFAESMKAKSHGNEKIGDGLQEKSAAAAAGFSEVPKPLATATKDSSLIQKIEGLNAKARASDVRHDVSPICRREEPNELQFNDTHSDHVIAQEASASAVFPENRDFNEVIDPGSSELSLSTVDRNVKLYGGAHVHRRPNRGMQGRSDHHGRAKVNTREVDGWHKRPLLDSPGMMATPNQESSVLARDDNAIGAINKAESFSSDSHGDVPTPSMGDSKDTQAQRTKMRELAKQRTRQLQEEEEERTRKQRARALAKLEELNRRTIAGEGPNQWSENVSNDAIRNKIQEPQNLDDPSTRGSTISGEYTTVSDPHVVANNSESTMGTNKNSPILSGDAQSMKPSSGSKEQVVAHNQLRTLELEASINDAVQKKNASEVNGGGASLKHKRTGNKQKPNIPSEKTEKIPHLIKDSKVQTVVADISVVDESSAIITEPVAEHSTHARKKNNKSGKSRHKVEETSISAASPQISKEANLTTEYDKPKASQSVMDPPSDPQPPINGDENQSREQLPLLPVVETLGKGNGQWKSQHSRRMPRNAQNRPGEKIHGSDSVIWAPVRSLNKCEITDETLHKNEAGAVTSSVKIDNQVQSMPKNKRAEREIYVPKPVVKEMAQQGTIHQDIFPMNQAQDDNKADSSSKSSDNTRPAGAVSGNVGFSTDHRNGDGRHHKQSKAHASWRQRGATEYGQGLQDQSSYVSNAAGSFVQKSTEYQVPEKATGSTINEFTSHVDEWDPPDGWNDPNYSASIPAVTAAVGRDQGVTSRGKRSQFKGHKGVGNNFDLNEKKLRSGDNEKNSSQSSVLGADQKDVFAAAKENRGVGERSTSHWQPKSRMVQPHNHQNSKPSDDQNVEAEAGQTNKMGSRPFSHATKTSDDVAQNQSDRFTGARTIMEEGPDVGPHGARVEKKIYSRKDRPYSPVEGPIHTVEVAPANTDTRRDQPLPTFYHKGGENNNRFGRGPESRRERNSSQHHKQQQHYPPANRDRQRQNLQYEYQPVGPHNGKPNMDNRPKDTTQHSGSRYVERGQGQSRRDGGNFHKQQADGVELNRAV
ncbi:protein MODIFIER OF SNC1 1-like [Cucurbita pepo subsp. pepo]|uniref:protein MODIFIER OF SNC1 1-like n=1 Tax=Cucurbita pepo subsp. pepo TaxID=3664 RepID=UPI000C9D6230|nr:protein MODIFIER OF SNC1 1-like [Cucurbita pepo subsp. pepo]